MAELLTDKEVKLLNTLGFCYSQWKIIYDETNDSDKQRSWDLFEFSSKIHDLQHVVMAQAARRANPQMFR